MYISFFVMFSFGVIVCILCFHFAMKNVPLSSRTTKTNCCIRKVDGVEHGFAVIKAVSHVQSKFLFNF